MYQEAADIRSVYLYKKFAVHGGGGGRTMFYRQKIKGGLQHPKYIIANGKLRQSSTFW